jgi:hypothetical protein
LTPTSPTIRVHCVRAGVSRPTTSHPFRPTLTLTHLALSDTIHVSPHVVLRTPTRSLTHALQLHAFSYCSELRSPEAPAQGDAAGGGGGGGGGGCDTGMPPTSNGGGGRAVDKSGGVRFADDVAAKPSLDQTSGADVVRATSPDGVEGIGGIHPRGFATPGRYKTHTVNCVGGGVLRWRLPERWVGWNYRSCHRSCTYHRSLVHLSRACRCSCISHSLATAREG